MTHRDTVADGDGGKYDRRTARHCNTELDSLDYLIYVHMSGNYLIIRADDTDKRSRLFLLGQTECVKQTAVGRVLHPVDNVFSRHKMPPISY